MPPLQLGVPFVLLHASAQPPQLLTSVLVLTSQPLLACPSQSAVPGLQAEQLQAPATQLGVPFGHEQTVPQPPQLLTSVWVLTSQPFAALLSQSA